MFDGVGIGAGGSGAAAGLLHAFTPKAKVGAEGRWQHESNRLGTFPATPPIVLTVTPASHCAYS